MKTCLTHPTCAENFKRNQPLARVHPARGDGPALVDPGDFPEMLGQLLAQASVRPPYGGHPRLFIWGLLEARLQRADLMIAGGRNMYTAYKAKLPFIDVNQEREHAFAGYDGMVELARQICLTLESPIWSQARSRAPWQQTISG